VAGVNLDGVANTDDTAEADRVDALRLLPPEALEAEMRMRIEAWLAPLELRADGTALTLNVTSIQIPPVGDPELPRDTILVLRADLPPGAQSVTLTWPAAYGTLALRQQGVEDPYTGVLQGGATSDPIALAGGAAQDGMSAFMAYLPVGFDHILPLGLDHILFVLGLFLLSTRAAPLLWQISAFTLAHTVTLALGALGIVNVPSSIVEPIIALSIVYVAVENLFSDGLSRWRPFVIFGFGLLHGLGFASVLGEFGLPQDQFIPALISFNVGVELGQLTVIAAAFGVSWMALRQARRVEGDRAVAAGYLVFAVLVAPALMIPLAGATPDFREAFQPLLIAGAIMAGLCAVASVTNGPEAYRRSVAMPGSVLIALVGAYWVIERVFL